MLQLKFAHNQKNIVSSWGSIGIIVACGAVGSSATLFAGQ